MSSPPFQPPPTPAKSNYTITSTERDFESELGGDAGLNGEMCTEDQEDAVHFCLLAEFDIDAGATLAHQYPYPTGTDEHRLAELMLPDGAHLRQEDWTIFYLGQTASSAVAPVLSHEASSPLNSEHARASMLLAEGTKRGVAGGGLLYVLNCVMMKEDKKMRRGAMVKAMAICTPNPYIGIYKPLLLLALEEYFVNPSSDVLAKLYDSANAISTAGMPSLSRNERILLRTTDRKDLFEEKFGGSPREPLSGTREFFDDASTTDLHGSAESDSAGPFNTRRNTGSTESRPPSSAARPLPGRKGSSSSSFNSRPSAMTPETSNHENHGRRKGVPWETKYFETSASFKDITLPIRIPMTSFDEDVGDYSIIELIEKFGRSPSPFPPPFHPPLHTNGANTNPVIVILNAMLAHKRVMFLGPALPSNQVARMVLAACALGSGCGQVLRGTTESAFPYANLASLDILEEFTGFVAGVTNPRFEELHMTWDVMCNLETGKVTVSKNLQSSSNGGGSSSNFGSLRSGRSSETSLANSIVKVDEDGTTGTPQSKMNSMTRADCLDNQFIDDTLAAIQSHYGEANLRVRVTDYLSRFVKLAAYHEYIHQGTTKIGYPVLSYKTSETLGSGAVFVDETMRQREMWVNSNRIDAWRKTKSYKLYQKDWQDGLKTGAIQGFDVQHQISRLRHAKKMSDGEAEAIFGALVQGVRTYDQVVELLTHLPPHWGGLMPIANGLFHQWPGIRQSAIELLTTIGSYPVGRHFLSSLNYFHRKTYVSLLERDQAIQLRHQEILSQREKRDFQDGTIRQAPAMNGSQRSPDLRAGGGEVEVNTPETVHASRGVTPIGV